MNVPTVTEKDLNVLFGLDGLSAEEKADFLEDVGMTLVESAVLRFMVEAEEDEAKRFGELIEKENPDEDHFKSVLEAFPRFSEILEEETNAFREEALAVLA